MCDDAVVYQINYFYLEVDVREKRVTISYHDLVGSKSIMVNGTD